MGNVFQEGVVVKLGGVDYTVKPLTIERDLEWRKRVGSLVAEVSRRVDRDKPNEFMAAVLLSLCGDGLDDLLETMWMLEWSPGLPPLDDSISRNELTQAMVEVFRAHYVPFVESLKDLMLLLA